MTAINVIVQRDRVTLATDSASYDPDSGEVIAFTSKSTAVPHWPGCVSTRGEALALPLLAFTLGQFRDFDDLTARIEDEIEDVHGRILPFLDYPDMPIDIVLAGWSKARGRGEAYYLRTSQAVLGMTAAQVREAVAGGAILPESYKLQAFGRRTFGPDVPRDRRLAAGLDRDTDAMSEPELAEYLRGIMELQRADLFDPGGAPAFSIVGGFAVATVIDASGIRQAVFHRWNDEIGQKINVDAAPIAAAPPLSRLKREMMERRQRKLARG